MKRRQLVVVGILCLCSFGLARIWRENRVSASPGSATPKHEPVPVAERHSTGDVEARALPRARAKGLGPKQDLRARPADEWQGMLVDVSVQQECFRSAVCGFALACIDGKCGPCSRDSECEAGEVCVLDHCVLRQLAACRTRKDCGDSLCLLTGLSADPRNNGDMRSLCSKDDVDHPESPVPDDDRPASPHVGPHDPRSLIENLYRFQR